MKKASVLAYAAAKNRFTGHARKRFSFILLFRLRYG